jgi:acylphosphatase
VGYRYSARQQATLLGLSGWVRNLWDGTVEVEAEGPSGSLMDFLAWLRRGPAGAHVLRVQVHWRVPQNDDESFEVRY